MIIIEDRRSGFAADLPLLLVERRTSARRQTQILITQSWQCLAELFFFHSISITYRKRWKVCLTIDRFFAQREGMFFPIVNNEGKKKKDFLHLLFVVVRCRRDLNGHWSSHNRWDAILSRRENVWCDQWFSFQIICWFVNTSMSEVSNRWHSILFRSMMMMMMCVLKTSSFYFLSLVLEWDIRENGKKKIHRQTERRKKHVEKIHCPNILSLSLSLLPSPPLPLALFSLLSIVRVWR